MKSIAKYEENVKKRYRIFCIFDQSGPRGLQCSETRLIPEEPLLLPLFCPALPQPTGNASRCGGCRKYGCGGDSFPSAGSRPDGLAELSTQVWRGVFSVLLGVCNRFNRAPEPAGYERPQKHAGHGYGNRARHRSSPPLAAGFRGRSAPGGAWPKPSKAAHPRPSWLRKSPGKPCVRGFLRLPAAARTALNRRTGR